MNDQSTPAVRAGIVSRSGLRSLHIFTICAFAITQPLLTALARQSVYLYDQQFSWLEIGVLLFVLSFVIPLAFLLVDGLLVFVSRWFHGWGRNSVIAFLFGVMTLSLARPLVSTEWLLSRGVSGLIANSLALACAALIVVMYDRCQWLQSWLTYASVGLVIFPLGFLWQFEMLRSKELSPLGLFKVKNPVPVVFVVFDEFSGTTLFNERMEIDSARFPQFARLAEVSTWYRNATTVHPRTDVAVPTILSGRFPIDGRRPIAMDYPGNLLQVIDSTKAFELAVFEPVSRLCPETVQHLIKPVRTPEQRCYDLIQTMAVVYSRLIITSDTPVYLPPIPRPWFGIPEVLGSGWSEVQLAQGATRPPKGLFHCPGTEFRRQQLDHFLTCLSPSEQPRFCFMHAVLPHYPWTFLATGEQYQSEFAAPPYPMGGRGLFAETWDDDLPIVIRNEHRYRQQVGYVDRFIGQVIDRLEATGLMEQCLLVITADHGVSFRPGHSRRLPDADNLPEIMSVPLFVKLPHQTVGRTDDRNVESVDLLPTIAEVLDLELPEPVDGISILKPNRHLRKSLYFNGKMTVVEADFPQRMSSARRQFSIYGNDPLDRLPAAAVSHPEWLGRQIASFEVEASSVTVELLDQHDHRGGQMYLDDSAIIRNMINGSLSADELTEVPGEIVLALNGTVIDVGKTTWLEHNRHEFQFLISPQNTIESLEQVELYLVDSTHVRKRLRRLKVVRMS